MREGDVVVFNSRFGSSRDGKKARVLLLNPIAQEAGGGLGVGLEFEDGRQMGANATECTVSSEPFTPTKK